MALLDAAVRRHKSKKDEQLYLSSKVYELKNALVEAEEELGMVKDAEFREWQKAQQPAFIVNTVRDEEPQYPVEPKEFTYCGELHRHHATGLVSLDGGGLNGVLSPLVREKLGMDDDKRFQVEVSVRVKPPEDKTVRQSTLGWVDGKGNMGKLCESSYSLNGTDYVALLSVGNSRRRTPDFNDSYLRQTDLPVLIAWLQQRQKDLEATT